MIGGTFASFSAEADNRTGTLAGGWIGAPSGLTIAPSGYDAQLAWTPGTHGPVTGQQLTGLDNGSSATCPASGYSTLGTMASASTASYTQGYQSATTTITAGITSAGQTTITVASAAGFPSSGNYTIEIEDEQMLVTGGQGTTTWTVQRGTSGTTATTHGSGAMVFQLPDPYGGHYYCFKMVSTSASNWTAPTSFPAMQLGLVATGVSIANGRNLGIVDSGDTVTITYNQQTTLTAASAPLCFYTDGSGNVSLYLDDVLCTDPTTDTYDAKLTGIAIGSPSIQKKVNASRTVSASAPWTVTYTISQNYNQSLANGTWTLTPSILVLSQNGGADQAHACTSATYNCTPTTTQSATAGF